jgi:hypothetical protein
VLKRDTAAFKACFSCTESFQHRAGAKAEVRGRFTKNVPAGTLWQLGLCRAMNVTETHRKTALELCG